MDVIREIIKQPLDQVDLKRMLGPLEKSVDIITYHQLQDRSLESLFHDRFAVIVYLDIHKGNGSQEPIGHWIALLKHSDHYEHFDPYGIGVDEEIALTNEKRDLITRLFKNSKLSIVESQRRLQSDRKDVNTCGRWVIARVRMGNYNLSKFYRVIDSINDTPDVAVVALTMFT